MGFDGRDDKIVHALLKRIMDGHYQLSFTDQYKEDLHDTFNTLMNARIPQHGVPGDTADGYINIGTGTDVVCAMIGRVSSL
ncbi:MAG: hypothetical protein Q8N94_02490 [Methanoregula sp.]|nr:hypothetical protein [Methanoregula sp.]